MKQRQVHKTILMLLCLCRFAIAQTESGSVDKVVSDIMERLMENQEVDWDYTAVEEQLEYYTQHKMDLNKASQSDFEKLLMLYPAEIRAILEHRKRFGDFIALEELQTIGFLNENRIAELRYFITTGDYLNPEKLTLSQMLAKSKGQLFLLYDHDMEKAKGYDHRLNSHYDGSPDRYMLRVRYGYGTMLSMGYSGEKDKGEGFLNNAQPTGFDFHSAYLFAQPHHRYIKSIALGDYQVNFGQGLTFSTGIGLRKSSYVFNVMRNDQSLKPYRSMNETGFMRGAAIVIQKGKLETLLFLSCKSVSASLPDTNTVVINTIQYSGLHRTDAELATKGNTSENILGGHLTYKLHHIQVGLSVVNTSFDKSFEVPDKPYQRYQFSGRQLMNGGLDLNCYLRNMHLFGELAYSSNNAFAGTIGCLLPLDEKLDLVVLYRHFAKDYLAIYSGPFSENSDSRNEEGIYNGISFKISRRWTFNSYVDFYRSAWLRYRLNNMSGGTDWLSELQYNPNKTTLIYLRFRSETKERNEDLSNLTTIIPIEKSLWRLHIRTTMNTSFSFNSRIELSRFHTPNAGFKQGSLIYEELAYTLFRRKLTLTGRIGLFRIDSYDARIYAVESDVLYQYSVPLFQDNGIRYHILLHYRIHKQMDVWFKFCQTQYINRTSVGSGLDEIKGNVVSDFKCQLRYSF